MQDSRRDEHGRRGLELPKPLEYETAAEAPRALVRLQWDPGGIHMTTNLNGTGRIVAPQLGAEGPTGTE